MARSSGETRYIVTEETQSWLSILLQWIDFDFDTLSQTVDSGVSTIKTGAIIAFIAFVSLFILRYLLHTRQVNYYVGQK